MNDANEIRSALASARTIAVVGCSPNPDRPSNAIARYLGEHGYRVIPVNPGHRSILGETCYTTLFRSLFRRSDHVAPVAEEAISRGVGFFFMQQGVVDAESARRLEAAGIPVAMDRCILVEHASRGLPGRNFDGSAGR